MADPNITNLTCQHGLKVRLTIESGAFEVALCRASGTMNPGCWPEFRNVAELGGPIPFILGSQYGGPDEQPEDKILWDLTLRDLQQVPMNLDDGDVTGFEEALAHDLDRFGRILLSKKDGSGYVVARIIPEDEVEPGGEEWVIELGGEDFSVSLEDVVRHSLRLITLGD